MKVNKSIRFYLHLATIFAKGGKTQKKFIARKTDSRKVTFEDFCERVGSATTYAPEEVDGMLNTLFAVCKDILKEGNSVSLGKLGTLMPELDRKSCETKEEFDPASHIKGVYTTARLRRKFKRLEGVEYEQVDAGAFKLKASSSTGTGGGSSEHGSEGEDGSDTNV